MELRVSFIVLRNLFIFIYPLPLPRLGVHDVLSFRSYKALTASPLATSPSVDLGFCVLLLQHE